MWEQIEQERKQQIAKEVLQAVPKTSSQNELKQYLLQAVARRGDVLPFEYEEIASIALAAAVDCIIAVEQENLSLLKKALQSLSYSSSWIFKCCTSVDELLSIAGLKPKIIIISHQLPGDHNILLGKVKSAFPNSRNILLAGDNKQYFEMATSRGFTDIVTGPVPKTPGDRPYTMLVALRYSKPEVIKGVIETPVKIGKPKESDLVDTRADDLQQKPNSDSEKQEEGKLKIDPEKLKVLEAGSAASGSQDLAANQLVGYEGNQQNKQVKTKPAAIALNNSTDDFEQEMLKISAAKKNKNSTTVEKDSLNTVIKHINNSLPLTSGRPHIQFNSTGKLILTTSSKGGVGKTTIALSLAMILANNNIKTCLCDFDFGTPNIAMFFNINKKQGMEVLAQQPFTPQLIDDVLIKLSDTLYVLPGSMDNTLPVFDLGKIDTILKYLKSNFPVVIGDTPPEFWSNQQLKEVFLNTDRVYSILNQSKFSEKEAETYAIQHMLFSEGNITPEKIGLILNMYDPDLRSPKEIENSFNAGFKISSNVKMPEIEAVIPVNTREYFKGTYDGKIDAIYRDYNQIHLVAKKIASLVNQNYNLELAQDVDMQKYQDVKANSVLKGLFQKFKS